MQVANLVCFRLFALSAGRGGWYYSVICLPRGPGFSPSGSSAALGSHIYLFFCVRLVCPGAPASAPPGLQPPWAAWFISYDKSHPISTFLTTKSPKHHSFITHYKKNGEKPEALLSTEKKKVRLASELQQCSCHRFTLSLALQVVGARPWPVWPG
jgi:hypothetical protein